MNRFLNILEIARDNKWCMNLYCTTCGATEFRAAMKQLGDGLADELASLDLSALTEMPNWDEMLRLVLDDFRKADLMDRVLTAWLPQLDRHIWVADLILFYYVRRGSINAPMSIEVLQRWRDKCIDLAVKLAMNRWWKVSFILLVIIGNIRSWLWLLGTWQDVIRG